MPCQFSRNGLEHFFSLERQSRSRYATFTSFAAIRNKKIQVWLALDDGPERHVENNDIGYTLISPIILDC